MELGWVCPGSERFVGARDNVRQDSKPWMWIVFTAGLDQASGWWARRSLSLQHPRLVWGHLLTLQLLYNRGAMLGLGARHAAIITVVGVVGTLALIGFAVVAPRYRWALATMAGGALGNVVSRLAWGQVTDFLHVAGYPGIFNVADICLRVGAMGLIAQLLWSGRRTSSDPAAASKPPSSVS